MSVKRQPRYQQLKMLIRDQILRGDYRVGDSLPPEHELAAMHRISRQTVRQSLLELRQEGLIRSRHGSGSYVTFQPDLKSSALKCRVVGLLTHGCCSYLFGAILQGIEQTLSENGFRLMLMSYDPSAGDEPQRVSDLCSSGICALISFPSYNSSGQWYRFAEQNSFPLIFVDNRLADVNADAVTSNGSAGAFEGASAMIRSGARAIAFLSGHLGTWSSRERLSGFQRALWKNGISDRPELVIDGPFCADFGYQTTQNLLRTHPEIDGIFVANHTIADGVTQCLWEQGVKIHHDIQIATFDNLTSPLRAFFPIISINQPNVEMGRKTAEMIIDRMDRGPVSENSPARLVQLDPQVCIPDGAKLDVPRRGVVAP